MFNPFSKDEKKDEKKPVTTRRKGKILSATNTALSILGINGFDHKTEFIKWVAEHNANLFNGKIKTAFSKLNNYLIDNDFSDKNWLSINKKSREGVAAYLIFAIDEVLSFQDVNISNRTYDVTGQLVEATIFYQPYEKNSITVLLYEHYQLVDKQVSIQRYFYRLRDKKKDKLINSKDFQNYLVNPDLKETQILNINYLPIIIMKNKPNEEPDCQLAMSKIAALDIFFEQIMLDIVVNAPKLIIGQIYGNQQALVERAVKDLITKNYLFLTELKEIQILTGNFKGKTLTDVVDWMFNEISKRIFLYIPGQKKSAEMTETEVGISNTGTVNAVEQKILLYKNAIYKFLKTLIKFDKDILNGKNFEIEEEISIENLKLEMDVINPGNNQLESKDSAVRKNDLS